MNFIPTTQKRSLRQALKRVCLSAMAVAIGWMAIATPPTSRADDAPAAPATPAPAATPAKPAKPKSKPKAAPAKPTTRPAAAPAKPNLNLYSTEHIEGAIQAAVNYIYSQQKDDVQWESGPTRVGGNADGGAAPPLYQGTGFGGMTALSTYALLAAGESPNDPRIQKAIHFLETADITGVYAIGLRSQVWTFLPDTPDVLAAAHHDYELLLDAVNIRKNPGFWHYYIKPNGLFDRSVSQYGVLGEWAASQRIEIDPDFWRMEDHSWRSTQHATGGWSYADDGAATHIVDSLTMTAAGVASLFIIQDELQLGNECTGNLVNPNIEAGLKYLADNMKPNTNEYFWYGMERVGVASGRKYIGDKDWYDMGVHSLLPAQNPKTGALAGALGGVIPSTDFFLLFISRSRAPVCMSKVSYRVCKTLAEAQASTAASTGPAASTEAHWNQRPRDLANFTHWLAQKSETFYKWETVNLDAPVSDLRDSSILLLDGDQGLYLPNDEVAKLKEYVESGGMIVGNADCMSLNFVNSFRSLGQRMFPYEFRELSPTHPIFTHQRFGKATFRHQIRLWGISNGVRELMILMTSDPSARWAVNATSMGSDAFGLGADVFEYAVDEQPLHRDEAGLIALNPKVKADHSVSIARLQFDGNWDPEPYGWTRLGAILHNQFKLDLTVTPVKLGSGQLNSTFAVASLTGTGPIRLNAVQQSELTAFVKGGGTLLVDAAGGDTQFAESAERELKSLFPQQATQLDDPLGPDNAVYNLPSAKIDTVEYRRFARKMIEGSLKMPRVRGLVVDGRTAVFFSAEDLSAGLVGETVDGIIGYAPDSATKIVRNIVIGADAKSLTAAAAGN